jgi:hypothetical protein
MAISLTSLELIAGGKIGGNQLESYFAEGMGYDFIRLELGAGDKDSFMFQLFCPDRQQFGVLEISKEQAYFLHGWLSAFIALEDAQKK